MLFPVSVTEWFPPLMTIPRNLIDLSHTVEHGPVTYKGLPTPIICDYLNSFRLTI
jgi:hypothetical protein